MQQVCTWLGDAEEVLLEGKVSNSGFSPAVMYQRPVNLLRSNFASRASSGGTCASWACLRARSRSAHAATNAYCHAVCILHPGVCMPGLVAPAWLYDAHSFCAALRKMDDVQNRLTGHSAALSMCFGTQLFSLNAHLLKCCTTSFSYLSPHPICTHTEQGSKLIGDAAL